MYKWNLKNAENGCFLLCIVSTKKDFGGFEQDKSPFFIFFYSNTKCMDLRDALKWQTHVQPPRLNAVTKSVSHEHYIKYANCCIRLIYTLLWACCMHSITQLSLFSLRRGKPWFGQTACTNSDWIRQAYQRNHRHKSSYVDRVFQHAGFLNRRIYTHYWLNCEISGNLCYRAFWNTS